LNSGYDLSFKNALIHHSLTFHYCYDLKKYSQISVLNNKLSVDLSSSGISTRLVSTNSNLSSSSSSFTRVQSLNRVDSLSTPNFEKILRAESILNSSYSHSSESFINTLSSNSDSNTNSNSSDVSVVSVENEKKNTPFTFFQTTLKDYYFFYYDIHIYSFFRMMIKLVIIHPLNNILQVEIGKLIYEILKLPTKSLSQNSEIEVNLKLKLCLLKKSIEKDFDKTTRIEGGGLIWYISAIFTEECIREEKRENKKKKGNIEKKTEPIKSGDLDSINTGESAIFLGKEDLSKEIIEDNDENLKKYEEFGSDKTINNYAKKLNELYTSSFSIPNNLTTPLFCFALKSAKSIEEVFFCFLLSFL
jgi:hypothetical protein